MAQQEEPLYDFPEPTQASQRKFLGHQRTRSSLRSISVLDRLLLTVPVWLQLSINPANALHILRREPPGTFLVRKSRTSQRNVLCIRLADDSVPSFVQQFGIRDEQASKTLALETSAISFPDLPRLISFYCVSRDVLPFPLELPEAISKATSHKELESISHMGIEFWSSQLNVRGPRQAPKPQKAEEKKPDTATSASPAVAPQTSSAAPPDSAPQPDADSLLNTAPESDAATKQSGLSPTVFNELCPIATRSPRELDCGSGLGALCFINPLFLQSQNALCRRRMFKRSHKVRISTEASTMLSPPLAPPPPPPLMPKTKGKSQALPIDPAVQDTQPQPLLLTEGTSSEARVQPSSATPHVQPEMLEQGQTQTEPGQSKPGVRGDQGSAQLPSVIKTLPEDSDYMQPSPIISFSHSPILSPYLSPSAAPMAPPLLPKVSPSLSPHDSPKDSPSLSPYQSPSLSPKLPFSLSPHDSPKDSPSLSPYQSPSLSPKLPFSLSPHGSPNNSPSLSPYQSPSPSPRAPFALSPFTSPSFSQLAEQVYHTPAAPSRADEQRSEREAAEEEKGAGVDGTTDEDEELSKEEEELVLQMNAASLSDTDSCSSFSSLEGAAESPPQLPHKQDDGTSL